MAQLDRLLVGLARAESRSRAALRGASAPPPTPEERLGMELKPGARVVDMVTGQEGVIVAGNAAHTLIPSAG